MKQLLMLFAIASFIGIFSPLAKGQATGDLNGLWAIDLESTLMEMEGQVKSRYDNMPGPAKEAVIKSFHSRTFDFDSARNVLIRFPVQGNLESVKGEWSYDHMSHLLIISATSIVRQYKVEWENHDRIRLDYQGVSSGGLMNRLWLVRQYR